jgi:hypothetical protein
MTRSEKLILCFAGTPFVTRPQVSLTDCKECSWEFITLQYGGTLSNLVFSVHHKQANPPAPLPAASAARRAANYPYTSLRFSLTEFSTSY